MELYQREIYLKKIRGFCHAADIIKVITGVRRCGKSSLMQIIAEELKGSGISADRIVFLNLDKREYRKIKTADQLDELIASFPRTDELMYLFIDEVQNVKDFEEVVNAYREDGGWSIFLTGSNSYLLSGELATKLTGRYIELELYPLTFDEYLAMKAFYQKPVDPNLIVELNRYILEGGFPRAIQFDDLADKRRYTESVVAEIRNAFVGKISEKSTDKIGAKLRVGLGQNTIKDLLDSVPVIH
jgi:predicted AAA+ superfamily ATPase